MIAGGQSLKSFDLRWCESVLNNLLNMRISTVFLEPSETSDIGLNMVQNRLKTGLYEHVLHFVMDIKSIYTNTLANAPTNALLVAMALDLWETVRREYAVKSKCPSEEWFKEVLRTTTKLNHLLKAATPESWSLCTHQPPPTFLG
jgi:hypothetical protein